ncbi:hypothetical protein WMF04_24570 [Sorangium sp. So ce260]|uniref:hypothetical protein n=1 Tax=Sorangium sp. So ce260 TaxID=3133291 RepID=UPI003F62CD49
MNKMIGYGASLLLFAGACGLVIGVSQAEAGDYGSSGGTTTGTTTTTTTTTAATGGGMEDKCDKLCQCIEDVLAEIEAKKNPGGNWPMPNTVIEDTVDALEDCLERFCDDKEPCPPKY